MIIPQNVYNYLQDKLAFIPNEKNSKLDNARIKAVPARIAFVSMIRKNKNYFNGFLSYSKLLTPEVSLKALPNVSQNF